MEVSYAFFAEAAQVTSDGRLNILGADLQTLSFQGPPPWAVPTLFLVATLRLDREDCGRLYHFTGYLTAPDGNRVEPHIETDVVAPTLVGQDTVGRMSIVVQMTGTTFPAPGVYHFRFNVQDRERNTGLDRSLPLRVDSATPS
jgi:hypothetical protein